MAEGDLTDAELLKHAETVESDPLAEPGFDEVVDLRAVRSGPSTGTMRETASVFRRGKRPVARGRIAIVASSDAGFGSGRMFEGLSGDEHVRTFRSVEEARAWLGIEGSPEA